MVDKIRYQVEEAFRNPNTFCLTQDELRERLLRENTGSVAHICPTSNNQGEIYHFNGKCGGLTVEIIGYSPRWVEISGDKRGFDHAKLILAKSLESDLLEGNPV